jgi:nitrate reductase assembly molybdenum cofactor insertion protein NarJ
MIVSQETLKQITLESDDENRETLFDVTTNCDMYKVHHNGNRYYLKDNIVVCQTREHYNTHTFKSVTKFEILDYINNEEARKSFDEGE